MLNFNRFQRMTGNTCFATHKSLVIGFILLLHLSSSALLLNLCWSVGVAVILVLMGVTDLEIQKRQISL